MVLASDVSLHGVSAFAVTKRGIPSSVLYGDLRDLETLVKKMDAIRNGSSTENCSCHGDEVGYGEQKTVCGGHSFSFNQNNLSVGHFNDIVTGFKSCSCDSHVEMYCDCHDNKVVCGCHSHY